MEEDVETLFDVEPTERERAKVAEWAARGVLAQNAERCLVTIRLQSGLLARVVDEVRDSLVARQAPHVCSLPTAAPPLTIHRCSCGVSYRFYVAVGGQPAGWRRI